MARTAPQLGGLGRVAGLLAVGGACVVGLGARPALANDIQFLSSDPAPGGTVYTLSGRYVLNITLSAVADTNGAYSIFVGTRLPPYLDYCTWGAPDVRFNLVAGQPRRQPRWLEAAVPLRPQPTP